MKLIQRLKNLWIISGYDLAKAKRVVARNRKKNKATVVDMQEVDLGI